MTMPEWTYRAERSAGRIFLACLFATFALGAVGREVWALVTHQTTWTLSAVLWWVVGPQWALRWWLVWLGLVVPFFLWLAVHVGFPTVEGRHLAFAVAVFLILAAVGWLLTR